jgi:hypothetical protein
MLNRIHNLKWTMFNIRCDISRMRDKTYRTESAIRAGRLPSVEIRHYCSDYGVRYNQSIADKCLWDAIAAANRKHNELEHEVYELDLEFEYACMC